MTVWLRWRALTGRQMLEAVGAAAVVFAMSPANEMSIPERMLTIALFSLFAVLFRLAIAAIEPLDGSPVAISRYVVACLFAATACALLNMSVIRPSWRIFGVVLPPYSDFWQGFFPTLSVGLALVLVHARLRSIRHARKRLAEARAAQVEAARAEAETARQGAEARLAGPMGRLDVDSIARTLRDIDDHYARDPTEAGRRIDALIADLRAMLHSAEHATVMNRRPAPWPP